MSRSAAVLYLSYDGLLEPLGESQVVAYVERLASDHRMVVLSYEKQSDLADRPRVHAMEARLASRGIEWVRATYHRSPPVLSTLVDVWVGIRRGREVARRQRIDILHARSYVASLIALGLRRDTGAAYLFDMRGFWVDEKVEGGHWEADGILYRVGKWWERRFMASADAIVSLTEAGASALRSGAFPVRSGIPVRVIPTCADLTRFHPRDRDEALARRLDLAGSPVIGCVGTISNWYMRGAMLECLAQLLEAMPDATALLVTRDDHEALRDDAARAGVPADRLVVTRASFDDMPDYLSLIDLGLFFIRPTFAKRGSAATKLAEFLASGVPVLINDGVGDSGTIVRERAVGIVLDEVGVASVTRAMPEIRRVLADPDVPSRCRHAAEEVFDLERGVQRYNELYHTLAGTDSLAADAHH